MATEAAAAGTLLGIGVMFAILFFLFFIAIFALAILAFVFWIMMLIDSIKREYKNENDKIVWVLVIVFTGIIGAIIYYFVVKKSSKKR